MAHAPKPFYRSARNAFYVQIGKQQIKLVAGPDDAATEKAAWAAFHALMAGRAANDNSLNSAISAAAPSDLTVAAVLDKYLDWCQKHRTVRTYE